MANINLSAAVRSNLSSLQSTATLMAKTSDRLSTGNKVNSALDNPTNFFTASSLNSRAGDLNQLMDSMNNGIKTIEAANNGLTAITKNLESMQSTLRQARQDKTFETQSYKLGSSTTGTISFSGGADIAANSISLMKTGTATQAQVGNVAVASYVPPTAAVGGTPTTMSGTAVTLAAFDFTVPTDTYSFDLALGTGLAETITLEDGDDVSSFAALQATVQGKINDAFGAGTITVGLNVGGDGLTFTTVDNTDDVLTVTDGSGTGAGAAQFGFVDDAESTGGAAPTTPATTYEFNVNGTAISLNSTNAATLDAARIEINRLLNADSNTAVTAALDAGGRLVIRGAADGSTNATITESGGGNDAATLFGSTLTANGTAGVAGGAKSVDDLVKEINSKLLADGAPNPLAGKVRASNDKGELRIENLSTQGLKIDGINAGGTIDGVAVALPADQKSVGGNTVRADLAEQFNVLRDALDKMSDDASFNGINLLRGDNLKITFNETGASSIDISTKGEASVNSSNLKLTTTLTAQDLDSDTGIDTFLDQVKGALNSVRSQASAFGSNLSIVQNRQDFTKSMINTLETGAGNLTLADMNQEAANMMALQTRQSLASSTLSMANQADQGVLQLLR